MLLGGDEIGRTQGGNNNAYNQDNPTSWLDWTMVDSNRELLRYVQRMIAFRMAHRALRQPDFYSGQTNARGVPAITWHGTSLGSPAARYLGSVTTAALSASPQNFTANFALATPIPAGQTVTATATSAANNTSQFATSAGLAAPFVVTIILRAKSPADFPSR